MFDPLRDKDDVVRDIKLLNEICDEWKNYHQMWAACVLQHNLKMEVCEHEDPHEKIMCKKCRGTGYIAVKGKEEK